MTDRERWQGIALGLLLGAPIALYVALIAVVQR